MTDSKSIWKKEISLKGKPKAPKAKAAKPETKRAEPTGVPRSQWWKKDLALSRKSKSKRADAPPQEPVADAPAPAGPEPPVLPPLPADAEVVYSAPPDRGWTLDPRGARAASDEEQTAVTEASSPEPPWWKKEISIGPKRRSKRSRRSPKRALKRKVSFPPARKPSVPKPALRKPSLRKPGVPRVLRRELTLPKPRLPKLSKLPLPARGGGHPRAKGGDTRLKKVVGLKIGASQIAAANVENNGHAELLQVVREPLDPGVVVGGELRDPEALTASLTAFFARHKLPRKNIRLGIASNRIGVRIFDLVGIEDDKALANAIQFRAQDALPIPLDEAVLDYQILSEAVDEEGRSTRRVLLVVAYRELVERYVAACTAAGLQVVGVDLEAFALLRALGGSTREGDAPMAATVAVSIGHERSTFAVTDGRVCEFTRVLEWGGSALNIALARALDSTPTDVESIKRSLSLDEGGPVPEGLTAAQATAAVEAMRVQVQTFARELVSSLQFYQHQPGSLGIGEIVVTGGTAHLFGLPAELQKLIGVPVRIGDPLARVRIAKKVTAAEQVGSLAVAIGLGIED